jgi:hypothetical protein
MASVATARGASAVSVRANSTARFMSARASDSKIGCRLKPSALLLRIEARVFVRTRRLIWPSSPV